MNNIGKKLVLTTFGESHGTAVGGILDGFPANFSIDFLLINQELARRKTGNFAFFSQRVENDEVEFLSGIFDGKTTGTPIAFLIKNNGAKSSDYKELKNIFRPSHADFTYQKKYGIRDFRGGGRASARETAVRVVAGALSKQFLLTKGISIFSYISQIGKVVENENYMNLNFEKISQNSLFTPNETTANLMLKEIEDAQNNGNSVGGVVTCVIRGVEVGLGEPIFDKLQAHLAFAMMSIPAAKGFDYGYGFAAAQMLGSEHNDTFVIENKVIRTKTNNCGGILGGISTGNDIYFRTAFKPTSSIVQSQQTLDYEGNSHTIEICGKHDSCFVPRTLPIVEAMAAIIILDFLL
jgi:chorismate synthase